MPGSYKTAIILITAIAQGVAAVPLTISNHSFEDITGQSPVNEFTLVVPNGWTAYNPSNLTSGGGLYFGTLETDGTFFDPPPDPAPDGDRVAILYNQNQKGAGEYGLDQTLTDTLQPLTQYTLQVEVGNIGSGFADSGDFFDLDDFPGYRIDLFAGTNLVVSDNDSLTIPERVFSNAVLQAAVGPDHPGIGEALTIRLVSLNLPLEPDDNSEPYDAHEVDFDDVRLDAVFSPELFSTSNGVSYALLIDAGLAATNASAAAFEAASLLNSDGDVHLDWQEYIAGTDPTNNASFFMHTLTYSNAAMLGWQPVSNRSYSVYAATNLTAGFDLLTNGLSDGTFTDLSSTNRNAQFYRMDVELNE